MLVKEPLVQDHKEVSVVFTVPLKKITSVVMVMSMNF